MKNKTVAFSTLITLTATLPSCHWGQERTSLEQGKRPNIIVIMSDDMGYSDIGCYGGEIRTPSLDKLAKNGIRMTQFYNTARCCPTRASLLTGLYPHQAGIGWMTGVDIESDIPAYHGDLSINSVTLAEVARSAGYSTFAVGKWHVSKNVRNDGPKHNWPLQRGFDRYYGTIQGAGSYWDPSTLCRDNTLITPFNDPEYKPEDYYYTDALSDEASRFIKERDKNKPFFLYLAYTAGHWPMHARQEDIQKYKGTYDGGWDEIRKNRYGKMLEMNLINSNVQLTPPDYPEWQSYNNKQVEAGRMETYAAMVSVMDEGIGRIVGRLKEEGILDNTLIVYLQDNGACAEEIGTRGKTRPVAPDISVLKPLLPDEPEYMNIPRITRQGKIVMHGEGISGGPDTTYVAYGKYWANASNTPFREYKHWLHEGGISTPMIIHYPDQIQNPGRLSSYPSHLIDIMPTLVELTGAKYPETVKDNSIIPYEGISLVSLFKEEPATREKDLFWEHEMNRAYRAGDWKLVSKGHLMNGSYGKWQNYSLEKWELYNMKEDRAEMNDLSGQYPEKVQELSALWEMHALRTGVFPTPWMKAE